MISKTQKRPKLLFIAEHIRQPHGSALSAIDVLRSTPSAYQKYILTEHRIPCGKYLHNAKRKSLTPSLSFRPHRLARIASRAFARLYSIVFLWWLNKAEFDVIVVNGFGSQLLWQRVCHHLPSSAISVVISRESPRHFDSPDRGHTLAEQINFLNSFHSQIFVSENLRREWIDLARLNKAHTYYLPNCCEENRFLSISLDRQKSGSVREAYQIPDTIPLIINVGTIELRKGQQDLEPLAVYLEGIGQDFRIACVGFDATEQGSRFRKRIQVSSLSRYFIFPGATDQVFRWYEEATLLAFTSRAEAMPRTVLEAMASALPIVSSNVDGIPELIDHLIDGYLYHPGDIPDLIRGVEGILADPVMARRMGAHAREKYKNHFSQALHAQRLNTILASVGNP